jgi:hypothetical protein
MVVFSIVEVITLILGDALKIVNRVLGIQPLKAIEIRSPAISFSRGDLKPF